MKKLTELQRSNCLAARNALADANNQRSVASSALVPAAMVTIAHQAICLLLEADGAGLAVAVDTTEKKLEMLIACNGNISDARTAFDWIYGDKPAPVSDTAAVLQDAIDAANAEPKAVFAPNLGKESDGLGTPAEEPCNCLSCTMNRYFESLREAKKQDIKQYKAKQQEAQHPIDGSDLCACVDALLATLQPVVAAVQSGDTFSVVALLPDTAREVVACLGRLKLSVANRDTADRAEGDRHETLCDEARKFRNFINAAADMPNHDFVNFNVGKLRALSDAIQSAGY